MRAFAQLFGEWLAQPPGEVSERLTPWVLAVLGGLVVGVMVYAWIWAPGL